MNEVFLQRIIKSYIRAYNSFDIDGMLSNVHDNVRFENISDGEVNLTTNGIVELKKQAEQAKKIFKEREQKITGIRFSKDQVEIDIDFKGIVAVDFPNGIKTGDVFELKGRSVFRFRDNKIIEIKDIS